ncbi:UNVERIFIED_CONTAM: hypothetical protein HHA_203330 [Hammondia hammondi]|eukprot:XP_008884618.1 hypothetical protein HHA_203330 [Hammondia hammondi]
MFSLLLCLRFFFRSRAFLSVIFCRSRKILDMDLPGTLCRSNEKELRDSSASCGCLSAEAFEHFRIREQQLLQLNEELERKKRQSLHEAEEQVRELKSLATGAPSKTISLRPKSAVVCQRQQSTEGISGERCSVSLSGKPADGAAELRAQSACSRPSASLKRNGQEHPPAREATDSPTKKVHLRESVLRDPYASGQHGATVEEEYKRLVQQGSSAIGNGLGGDHLESLTATVRLQKSRLLTLQEELESRAKEIQTYEQDLHSSQNHSRFLTDENEKLKRKINHLISQGEKHKASHAELSSKVDALEKLLAELRAENDRLTTTAKKTAAELNSKEARVTHLTKELESTKEQLKEWRSSSKDRSSELKQMEKLAAENKKLENQRNELVLGFKRQMKLIDILKKQKAHMEAARLLSFTEDEFLKILQADERNGAL